MNIRQRFLAGWCSLFSLCVVILVAGSMISWADKEPELKVKDLPEHWRTWIEDEVYPLITKDQIDAFLRLETESQRKAFVERLWLLWGRQTGHGSAFRQMYQRRLETCRIEFEHMTNDRARVLLIHGPPDFIIESRCPDVFNPLEIWGYQYIEGLGRDVVVVFYRPDGLGYFRMWHALESESRLYTFTAWRSRGQGYGSRLDSPEFRCMDGDAILRLIAQAKYWSRDPRYMAAMSTLRGIQSRDPESASERFMEFSALLDDNAEPLPFETSWSPRGLRGSLVQMGFAFDIPRSALGSTTVGEVDIAQVDVIGEISRDDEMVDRFRYLFSVPASGEELTFLLERFIRPGDYELRVKVADVHSKAAAVEEYLMSVTADGLKAPQTASANKPPGSPEERATLLLGGETLKLIGPGGEAISGIHRFEALADERVARVSFRMDGREVLVKNRPPFDVDLDLGPLPHLTTVTAIAYDANEQEIDRDELSLNVGRERFFLRLHPIGPGNVEGDKVKVSLTLNTPGEAELERVDIFWNERQLATLFQPPFEAWVKLDQKEDFGYLRAVAVLSDGAQAEDIQFVNAPRFGSIVDVTTIELPVVVLDRNDDPVDDLEIGDFEVYEDGVLQDVTHCSLHQDLPVRMGLIIDTSGSMKETLPEVQRVVMGFLRKLLRPRDRAFIETFSDQPDVLAPFTADFQTLENALLALYADRSTSLYDGIIMGLFQFSGVQGRKAMVVLTDGEDTASKNDFDTVVDFAQRAGVTLYAIGIDLPPTKVRARWHLSRVASVTGGRSFFLSGKSELERVYDQIDAELRTQYLLVYTSNSTKKPEELREVEVKVDRKRTKVRTFAGYYPGG